MKKKITVSVLTVLVCMVFVFQGHAANTITGGKNTCTVESIDSDWKFSDCPTMSRNCQRVQAIVINPGAAGDVFFFRSGDSANGAQIFPNMASDETDQRVLYFNGSKVCITYDHSESTVSSGGFFHVIFAD